jgi:hypothetical protein
MTALKRPRHQTPPLWSRIAPPSYSSTLRKPTLVSVTGILCQSPPEATSLRVSLRWAASGNGRARHLSDTRVLSPCRCIPSTRLTSLMASITSSWVVRGPHTHALQGELVSSTGTRGTTPTHGWEPDWSGMFRHLKHLSLYTRIVSYYKRAVGADYELLESDYLYGPKLLREGSKGG